MRGGKQANEEEDDKAAEAKPWQGRGGIILLQQLWRLRRRQSTKVIATVTAVTATTTRATKRARALRAIREPSPREEGDDGPPPVVRVHTSMVRILVVTTARAMT